MTHSRSHATVDRLKQLANAPTSPASVGQVWRERFPTDKRYRNGGDDGMDGVTITPECPTGPKGNSGGIARRMPTDLVLS